MTSFASCKNCGSRNLANDDGEIVCREFRPSETRTMHEDNNPSSQRPSEAVSHE